MTRPLTTQTNKQPHWIIAANDIVEDSATTDRIEIFVASSKGKKVTVSVSSEIMKFQGNSIDATTATRLFELVGRIPGVVII